MTALLLSAWGAWVPTLSFPTSSSSSSSFIYRSLSRLPRGRAACPKPVHKGLGLPGVAVQLHAKPPGSSAQGRGHTARFPNMTKLQTMVSPASARLKAPCLATSMGGGKVRHETRDAGCVL